MTVLLALTGSRSGWAAFIAGLACLVVLWAALTPSRRRLIWIGLLLGAGFALLFALWLGPEQWQQLWQEPPRETPFGTLSTLSFRQEIWRWALAAIRSFPLTGTGLGTFRRVVFRFYPIAVVPDYDPAHAHNVFLQVALDVGLPGLVAYLALLMVAAVIAWRVARRNAALRPFAIGLFAGLVAFHAFGILDAIALGQKPAFLLWMTLGMLAALTRIDAKTAGKPALQN
jgi:putative inorganic carbon (HCO3(-)) transporter